MTPRAFAYPHAREPEPLAAINITPLIDVMLVLLIMMILSIPAITNTVPIGLPQQRQIVPLDKQVAHLIDLDPAGIARLDGRPVSDAELAARLARLNADPANVFHLRIDGHARYVRADATLAAIKRAGVTRLGFIGNDRFADFDRF